MTHRALKLEYDPERKLYQPKLSEEHVLCEIVERLWLQANIKVWRIAERIPVKGKRWQRLSTPGIPDLWGWIANIQQTGWTVPLLIEVKCPGGRRRPAQERFIEEAKAGGCCAFFAESWDDVVQEMKHCGVNLSQ